MVNFWHVPSRLGHILCAFLQNIPCFSHVFSHVAASHGQQPVSEKERLVE